MPSSSPNSSPKARTPKPRDDIFIFIKSEVPVWQTITTTRKSWNKNQF